MSFFPFFRSQGVSDPMLREHFQGAYSELVPVINEMLGTVPLANIIRTTHSQAII
jgi:hypothetical protein